MSDDGVLSSPSVSPHAALPRPALPQNNIATASDPNEDFLSVKAEESENSVWASSPPPPDHSGSHDVSDLEAQVKHSPNSEHTNHKLKAEDLELQDRFRKHPLFPLVEFLLAKCEQATWDLNGDSDLQEELEQLIVDVRARHGSVSCGDVEVDALIAHLAQVLRFQLLELDKVNDLCKEFCDRYINSIKCRINQESLLGCGADSDDDFGPPPADSGRSKASADAYPVATIQTPNGPITVQLNSALPLEPSPSSDPFKMSGGWSSAGEVLDDDMESDGSGRLGSKRTALPRKAVEVLKQWLFQHVIHPYPTELEKRRLGAETGLNLMQVNNWFINARRRILPPIMDEQTTSGSPSPKRSRQSPPVDLSEPGASRPILTSAQRYWPFAEEQAASDANGPQETDDSPSRNSVVATSC